MQSKHPQNEREISEIVKAAEDKPEFIITGVMFVQTLKSLKRNANPGPMGLTAEALKQLCDHLAVTNEQRDPDTLLLIECFVWFYNQQVQGNLPEYVSTYLAAVESIGIKINEKKTRPIGQPSIYVKHIQVIELTQLKGVVNHISNLQFGVQVSLMVLWYFARLLESSRLPS